jgi:hypothetical protein
LPARSVPSQGKRTAGIAGILDGTQHKAKRLFERTEDEGWRDRRSAAMKLGEEDSSGFFDEGDRLL